jgi:hypothetical protein
MHNQIMHNERVRQLVQRILIRAAGISYEGWYQDDPNFSGNILLVQSEDEIYSFAKEDVLDHEDLADNLIRIWVQVGASALWMPSISGDSQALPFTVGMEEGSPSSLREDPAIPRPASVGEAGKNVAEKNVAEKEVDVAALRSLCGVGAAWTNSCIHGDRYPSNCAHFLSDAFIRAGYTELLPPNEHISASCPSKRPIRAREMWGWFKSKAVRSSHTVTRNTGWWAVFQLNERVYWGGHVVLLDSDSWQYYGTGWYKNWNQYLYQF